jgi:hypothetical protein
MPTIEKILPELTPTEIAYIAGLVDGEGCITLTAHNRKSGKNYITPHIQIVNTYKGVIDWLQGKLRFACARRIRSNRPNRVDIFSIDLKGRRIQIQFLEKVLPYLIIKRKQAEIQLAYLKKRERLLALPLKYPRPERGYSQRTAINCVPYDESDFQTVKNIQRLNHHGLEMLP